MDTKPGVLWRSSLRSGLKYFPHPIHVSHKKRLVNLLVICFFAIHHGFTKCWWLVRYVVIGAELSSALRHDNAETIWNHTDLPRCAISVTHEWRVVVLGLHPIRVSPVASHFWYGEIA